MMVAADPDDMQFSPLLGSISPACVAPPARQTWSWQKVRAWFAVSNPALQASNLIIHEPKAQEITACLRPRPNLTLTGNRIGPFGGGPPQGPFAFSLPSVSLPSINLAGSRLSHPNQLDLAVAREV